GRRRSDWGPRRRTRGRSRSGLVVRRALFVALARPLALDPQEDRASDVDRAEGTGDDTEEHDPRERTNDLAREDQQRQRRGGNGDVREDGPRQRLVDRAIEDVVQ